MGRGVGEATVHGVAKSQTWLKQLSTHDQIQAECRTFSKSSKNKWFKLVLGLVFRSFPAFPTLSHDLLSILIADPDSALIQTILMMWAYSSKYGFLVLLFSFLYDSERYAHVST